MFNNQSSTSLEDLSSLSSVSSTDSTKSIYNGNYSTISSCNESPPEKNKSLPQINCDLENISTSSSCSPKVAQSSSTTSSSSSSSSSSLSALINQKLRQKMLSLNIHPPDNLKKRYKKVTFNSEQRDDQTVNIVKEISEKQSISHKFLPTHNMDITEVKKIADNQLKKSVLLQPTKSANLNKSIPVNSSDVSSVSSIEVAPSTIKQFKFIIEKQKNYLDCLQRELNRLQRMEDVLSELHYKSELQKRVVSGLSYSNCEGNCSCQSFSKQDNEFHKATKPKTNPKPSEPENEPEDLSDISTVESVVSITPLDQTSYVTCPMDNSKSMSRVSSKGKIHPIHAQIDRMIDKLHEESVTKHSIGVQTSDSLIEPQKPYQSRSTTIRKSANNKLNNKQIIRETLENPVAWTIIIPENDSFKIPKTRNTKGQAYYLSDDAGQASDMTLQQAFRLRCGHFQARSLARVRQINVASAIRKATAECRLERQLEEFLLRNQLPRQDYDFFTGSNKVKIIKPKKIFTEKEMRQQTKRLYSDLPEIKKRKEEKRREEYVKTHRIMAKNFSQRLKSKAVEGTTTFPLTQRLTNY